MVNTLLSLDEFMDRFGTEEACMDYLYQSKWSNGFVCPQCGHRHAYRINSRKRPLFQCTRCHHQTSLTVGTIMEGSRTDLTKWFKAFYLISRPEGISSLQLAREIEVTLKTAWLILHKIRHAMSVEDASCPLSGSIYVNEARYGRIRGLESIKKQLPVFVGTSMDEENEPLYVKMKIISREYFASNDVSKYVLKRGRQAFIQDCVEANPTHIDFSPRYQFKDKKTLFRLYKEAFQWINDTFHGMGGGHMQAYFNEFCYRVNLRLKKQPVFDNLVQLCTMCKKITYADLINRLVPVN